MSCGFGCNGVCFSNGGCDFIVVVLVVVGVVMVVILVSVIKLVMVVVYA